MLILSRHKNESIIIGTPPNQIIITVAEIRGDRVRIGINAPQEIPVHRQEVYEAIHRITQQAELFKQENLQKPPVLGQNQLDKE